MSNNNVNFYFIPDPIVKIYLLYNNQRIAKKKTHVKKRTLNPVFNESFLFDIPYNEGLQNISMEFLVMDWDRMTKNEVIGRLEIGGKSSGQELHHWNEVMNCPRKQIAEWHKLREWNGRARQKKRNEGVKRNVVKRGYKEDQRRCWNCYILLSLYVTTLNMYSNACIILSI